jgi:hypothetical protein
MIMEEDRILAGFHQEVQKARDKAWHDRHIKRKNFKEGGLVLVYDSQSLQHPRKLRMHSLGPYKVRTVIDGGVVGKCLPSNVCFSLMESTTMEMTG